MLRFNSFVAHLGNEVSVYHLKFKIGKEYFQQETSLQGPFCVSETVNRGMKIGMHGVRQQEVSCLVEETLSLPLAASNLVVAGVKNILVKLQFWRMTSLAVERPPPSPGRWSLGTMGEKEAS